MGKKWNDEEKQFLIRNYNRLGNREIGNTLGRSRRAICMMAHVLGIRTNNKGIKCRQYHFNDDFFSKCNIVNSYVAGFISGDGYISYNSNLVKIKLSIKDLEFLKRLVVITESNCPVHIYNFPSEGESCIVEFNSKKWQKDLERNFNVTYEGKKYKSSLAPVLDDLNSLAFINGLIDSDGWISLSKRGRLSFGVYSTYSIIEWIRHIARKYTNSLANMFLRYDSGIYVYELNQDMCYRFLSEINSLEELSSIRLNRKWDNLSKWKLKYRS